jgi:ABC-type glutathione transport system ATPase component
VILDALDRLMVGRTSLMIAHRLSTIRKADLIIVVNRGRVSEVGSHEELLTSGGLYFQLYQAQNGEVAEIEAEHLRRQASEQPVSANGDQNGNGLDREVIESLASAVRRRIRASLANGGGGNTALQEDGVNGELMPGNGIAPPADGGTAPPNGGHAAADGPPAPPEGDDGRTP